MPEVPDKFIGVTAVTKANVYFDGKVVSHAIILPDGSKKTLGLIYPGKYHFNTEAAEKMEIVAGSCRVLLDGSSHDRSFVAGEAFEVGAKSGFSIQVQDGLCEYICSFLS